MKIMYLALDAGVPVILLNSYLIKYINNTGNRKQNPGLSILQKHAFLLGFRLYLECCHWP